MSASAEFRQYFYPPVTPGSRSSKAWRPTDAVKRPKWTPSPAA